MIITNSTIISWVGGNQLYFGKDVVIIGDKIFDIDDHRKVIEKFPNEPIVDAGGKILMPGLICAHTHFYGLFSRGLGIPGKSPQNFLEILNKLWWPLDSSLEMEDVRYCALVCLIDAIKHGTTTLFDHHASPKCAEGSLDTISNAFYQTGVRGVVSYETTNRYGSTGTRQSIDENLRMIRQIELTEPSKRLVNASFGVHAGLTISEKTLETIRERLPEGYGIHIHVAEDKSDEDDSIKKAGMRVIERLNKFGLVGEDSILVHGVHLSRTELEIINSKRAWITHQPRSNMNNAVGVADVETMLGMGIQVCLGNDGFSNAMWDEWRTCYLVHKLENRDPQRLSGELIVKMAIENNSDLTNHLFKDQLIGKIQPGYQADLILVDYQPITEMNSNNLPWHILFGFRDSMVTHTMVKGKWLMKDKKFVDLDENEINKKALTLSKNVWKRYQSKF